MSLSGHLQTCSMGGAGVSNALYVIEQVVVTGDVVRRWMRCGSLVVGFGPMLIPILMSAYRDGAAWVGVRSLVVGCWWFISCSVGNTSVVVLLCSWS